MNNHGSSWDPNVVGPLDRCTRCWTPLTHDIAYCVTCGHVSLAFNSLPLENGERCSFHTNSAAEWTCCLCQRPICKVCCARETNPFTAAGPLWHCHECVEASNKIEADFLKAVVTKNYCIRHREMPQAFSCKRCGTQLCLSCTYFTVKGLIKKRPADGPYCLGCFRLATVGRSRGKWFSGHDIAPAFLRTLQARVSAP